MTTVLVRALGLSAAALTLAACGAGDGEGGSPPAVETDNGAWKAVPFGRGTELALHATHAYHGARTTRCGPSYELDVTVAFGTVTESALGVDAVTVVFRPREGGAVVPRKLDVWSDLTADKQVVDGTARSFGARVRYDVKRDYTLDPNDPIVVLELESAGAAAPDDPSCRQVTRFVFYAGAKI